MELTALQQIVEAGESETVEFKKSTAQLSRAGETLCAFLNGRGGRVLFGRDPLPDYPQCHLRLARFRGIDSSEFLDNRQVYGHAFRLLEEGMAFLLRHLPSGYLAPHRVVHDLTGRQREILQILARHRELPLREIRASLSREAADRTIQEDLAHLRRLDLVDAAGRGRGARYWLRRSAHE